MNLHCVLWIMLASVGLSVEQQLVLPSNFSGIVGGNVTLMPSKIPSPYDYWSWRSDNGFYISYYYYSTFNSNTYKFDYTTLSLEFWNLTKRYAGNYTLYVDSATTTGNTESYVSQYATCTLQIFDKVFGATIDGPKHALIENNFPSAILTCNASGDVISTEWMKDNQRLTAGQNIIFSADNKTMTINPVSRKDAGEYQCNISNPASYDNVKFNMIVYFGPDNLRIVAPSVAEVGQYVILKCTTESTPSPEYQWTMNDTFTFVNTAEFIILSASFSDSGKYTCRTWNYETGRITSGSHILLVKDKFSLSVGAIAGIVIAAVAVIAGIVGLIVFVCVKKRKTPRPNSSENNENQNQDSEIYVEPDSIYETVSCGNKVNDVSSQDKEESQYVDISENNVYFVTFNNTIQDSIYEQPINLE